MWHKKLWLIYHGAALYFHHTWANYLERSRNPFQHIKDHILLQSATVIKEIDAPLAERLTPDVINEIVSLIPDAWLTADSQFMSAGEYRRAYADYLLRRLEPPRLFVEEAERVRASFV
jgi:hypothetical protein